MTTKVSPAFNINILGSTVLATAASSLPVGNWVEFTGFTGTAELFGPGNTSRNIPYSHTQPWSAIDNRVHMICADHGAGQPLRYIVYDDLTNAFIRLTDPTAGGHAYDHNTINPTTGDLYHQMYFDTAVRKFTKALGTWSNITARPAGTQITYGSCWWTGSFSPGGGNGAQGTLVVLDQSDNWQIFAYDPLRSPPGGTWYWTLSPAVPGATSSYHGVMEYSPVYNCAIFGGSNLDPRTVRRLNSDGTITNLGNTPFTAGWGVTRYACFVDPVTGTFLFLGNNELWELVPTGSGTWTQLTGTHSPPTAIDNPVNSNGALTTYASISTYRVIWVLTIPSSGGPAHIYLYKRA